jgi:regulator of RNase E activity RraA
MTELHPTTRERLIAVSTATLTTVLFKRGFRNVCLQGLRPASSATRNMVGRAFTLRYIPAREDLDGIGAFDSRSHPQRVAIEECPAVTCSSWTAGATPRQHLGVACC